MASEWDQQDDSVSPPSFIPSSHKRAENTDPSIPPSFTPSGAHQGTHRVKPKMTPAAEQTAIYGSHAQPSRQTRFIGSNGRHSQEIPPVQSSGAQSGYRSRMARTPRSAASGSSYRPAGAHAASPQASAQRSAQASNSLSGARQQRITPAFAPSRTRSSAHSARQFNRAAANRSGSSYAPGTRAAAGTQPSAYGQRRQQQRVQLDSTAAYGYRYRQNSGAPTSANPADSQQTQFRRYPTGARPTTHAAGRSGASHGPLRPNGNAPHRHGASLAVKKPRKRHLFLKIFSAFLALVLALFLWAYSWINSQLVHYAALDNYPSDSAETWLITGSDVRDGAAGTGAVGSTDGNRTDSILLLIKPKSGPCALISIPRDTYVTVHGQDMKINAAAETYGWPALTGAVEKISGIKINHTVRIGFDGVENIVNALGGVTLCYDRNVNDPDSGMKWTPGCHAVDGAQALAFSRMRHQDPLGDIGREARQRQVIQVAAKKMMTPGVMLNFGKATTLISAGLKSIKVNDGTTPFTLISMALAFKDATGKGGITGMPWITNANYYPPSGLGSTILLDKSKTLSMFKAIEDGTQPAGKVGGYEYDY